MGDDSPSIGDRWASWLVPLAAIRMLVAAGIGDQEQAVNWLKGRLKDGSLKAVGWEPEFDEEAGKVVRHPVSKKIVKRVVGYKASIWKYVHLVDRKDDLWISGTHHPDKMPNSRDFEEFIKPGFFETLDRVRFDPQPIEEFCAKADVKEAGRAMPKAVGGRPPKPFWDQLWPFIAAALYNGDLKPSRQSDIEKAMADWISANGHAAGESTVRRAARALWQAINREDQN